MYIFHTLLSYFEGVGDDDDSNLNIVVNSQTVGAPVGVVRSISPVGGVYSPGISAYGPGMGIGSGLGSGLGLGGRRGGRIRYRQVVSGGYRRGMSGGYKHGYKFGGSHGGYKHSFGGHKMGGIGGRGGVYSTVRG